MLVLVHLKRYYKKMYVIALTCFLANFYFASKGTMIPSRLFHKIPVWKITKIKTLLLAIFEFLFFLHTAQIHSFILNFSS